MSTAKAAIQIIAIAMVSAGITFELATGAPFGYVLITAGAVIFAISTKIREQKD